MWSESMNQMNCIYYKHFTVVAVKTSKCNVKWITLICFYHYHDDLLYCRNLLRSTIFHLTKRRKARRIEYEFERAVPRYNLERGRLDHEAMVRSLLGLQLIGTPGPGHTRQNLLVARGRVIVPLWARTLFDHPIPDPTVSNRPCFYRRRLQHL
jgi:hypothetical protein